MRLLECNNDGEFSLTKDFVGGKIPAYAILSHTWGADTEEVTYRDLIEALGRTRLHTRRFGSAENKPDAMVSSTSGLIRVVSTNQTIMSSQKLSILCFDGTVMRRNATSICQMFRRLPSTSATSLISFPRNRHSEQADGLREAGPFKSLLLRHQLSSSLRTGSL
jgi:hypothetical protein